MIAAIGQALTKMASLTSIIRTRDEDGVRNERHDGNVADLIGRFDATAAQLTQIARRLESKLD